MQRGFTLLEVILAMAILGLVGLGFSQGLATMMQGRQLAVATSTTLGKGQIAMMRLTKEISQYGLSAIANSSLAVDDPAGPETAALAGTTVTLGGDVLVDTVQAFNLRYYDSAGAQVPASTPVGSVATVELELTLAEPGTGPQTFTTRVALAR